MMLKVFAIYDIKAKYYLPPFTMPSVGEAVRGFSDLACDKNTVIGRHPTDYLLHEVGDFDNQSGLFVSFPVPRNLGLASDFIPVGPVGMDSAPVTFESLLPEAK